MHRQGRLTVSSEECDSSTLGACTAGTANAVDVVLRIIWIVIVEHMGNVAHVLMGEEERLADRKNKV